jgi:phosphatidylethanolamine-binding protein (PEBP) family uncharacterized protein
MRLLVPSTIVAALGFALSAQTPAPRPMTLTIAGFPDGGQIPVKFSQAAPGVAPGEGTSPAMSWANVPAGTESFFLHMHDMDVARNKTTDDQAHWVFWNIPGDCGRPAGRCRQGIAIAGRKLSDQRHRTHVPRSRSRGQRTVPPLRV